MDVNFKMDKLIEVENLLSKYHHEHLLKYYNLIKNKEKFLDEILKVDFKFQEKLYNSTKNKIEDFSNDIIPTTAIEKQSFSDEELKEYERIGEEEIKKGKLAVVTLAGGQGTRLGHNGPKGTYELLPNLSLFEILCNNFKNAYSKYECYITWYIMTSKDNYSQTVSFFEEKNYFNYQKENIVFFIQEDVPENTLDGKLLVDENENIKRGANGHGGVFTSMQSTGILKDAQQKEIDWIYVTPVDNPLIELVDPVFIGVAKKENYNAIGKTIVRKNPSQKQGVFCLKNNKLNVMEYTEIPKELMEKENPDGSLYFKYAHINCNMFSINIIDKLLQIDIPYHIASKKCTFMDLNGNIVVPTKPNSYKYEKFIFDYFPHISKIGIYVVDRKYEYEPIKDNAEKARNAYIKKWRLK